MKRRQIINPIQPDALDKVLDVEVLSRYNISKDEMLMKSRKRNITEARQIYHYFYYLLCELSLSKIGFRIGRKDHATVSHSFKTIKLLQDIDEDKETTRKLLYVFMFLCFYGSAYSQTYCNGEKIEADTVYIYQVGPVNSSGSCYKIDYGQKCRVFRSYLVTDAAGDRQRFKSAKNAAEHIGGEIIGFRFLSTEVGTKKVLKVKLNSSLN